MFLPANITLKFGDSGDFVSELQRRLAAVNCFDASAVNGFFDGVTVNGVSMFQSMNGLKADGIAGPETLRRLNGVISGDTSTSDHDAEQNRLRQEEAARQLLIQEAVAQEQRHEQERLQNEQLAAERTVQAQHWQHTQTPQQPEIQYAQEAAYAPQQHQQQHAAQQQMLAAEQLQQQHLQQQQLTAQTLHAPHAAQAPAPHAGVQQHQPQHQPHMATQQVAQQLATQQPQAQAIPVQQHAHAAHAPAQVHVIAAAPPVAAAAVQAIAVQAQPAAAISPQVAPAQAPAAEPATGIKAMANRAVQYANDMVQKLSNYFESKLRPDVIDQVKEIGQVMARSGVREAAIPMGPEPQRAAETPTRAPQQQSQRG